MESGEEAVERVLSALSTAAPPQQIVDCLQTLLTFVQKYLLSIRQHHCVAVRSQISRHQAQEQHSEDESVWYSRNRASYYCARLPIRR
mgnify:CR=1 FL=1